MKPKYANLAKLLKNHTSHCRVHEFSSQEKRHCTCGVEKARKELEELMAWVDVVEGACIVSWIEMTDPEETIAELINRNVFEALDPQISQQAVDLILKHGGKVKY